MNTQTHIFPSSFHATADALLIVSEKIRGGVEKRDYAWNAALPDELDGTGYAAAWKRARTLLDTPRDIAEQAHAVATVLRQTGEELGIVASERDYLEELIAALDTAEEHIPALSLAFSELDTLSHTLDAACAAEIMHICGQGTEPTSPPLAALQKNSAQEINDLASTSVDTATKKIAEAHGALTLEAGDHHLVFALGDIDTAPTITTIVPGVGSSDPSALSTYMERAEKVRAATGGAVVLWLGYSAPTSIIGGLSHTTAQEAGEDLHAFQAALRARAPQGQKLLLLGHSYGSTVVGRAAGESTAHTPLAADALILAGSPGAGVQSVADMHFDTPNTQVYAETAEGDPIALTTTHNAGVHGPSPTSQEFGAHVWESEGGHSSYWDNPDFYARLGALAHKQD